MERLFLRTMTLGAFGTAFALLGVSFTWEYYHDTPLLNYAGWLVAERGFVPYRDVFETSMPGIFAIHTLIAKTGLTTNFGFIALNAVLQLFVAGLAALLVRPISHWAALITFGAVIGLTVITGPTNIMQRDWFASIPISAALLLALAPGRLGSGHRVFLIGILFGCVATIKPQLALGAPVVVLAECFGRNPTRSFRSLAVRIAISLAGFSLVIVSTLLALAAIGALDGFFFLILEYLPLHIQQNGSREFLEVRATLVTRLLGALDKDRLYALFVAVGFSAAGVVVWLRSAKKDQRIIVISLLGLSGTYALIPGISGQYWTYHYLPFIHLSACLIAIFLATSVDIKLRPLRWALRLAVLVALAVNGWEWSLKNVKPHIFTEAKGGKVNEVASALRRWTPEGGKVQPYDWSGGIIHAMLREKIEIATPFMYAYHFLHHVYTPTNKELRGRMIEALKVSRPDVFVWSKAEILPQGFDTVQHFDELERFVAECYHVVEDHDAFVVYLRNPSYDETEMACFVSR